MEWSESISEAINYIESHITEELTIADMNAPVPRPTPNYGTKCPRRIATLTKKQTDFSLKIEMGGKPF